MPFEIDYGSDATRSAGDWSYETFAEADRAFKYDDARASRGDLHALLPRDVYGVGGVRWRWSPPRDALAVSRSGREGWASIRAEPLFRGFCINRRA